MCTYGECAITHQLISRSDTSHNLLTAIKMEWTTQDSKTPSKATCFPYLISDNISIEFTWNRQQRETDNSVPSNSLLPVEILLLNTMATGNIMFLYHIMNGWQLSTSIHISTTKANLDRLSIWIVSSSNFLYLELLCVLSRHTLTPRFDGMLLRGETFFFYMKELPKRDAARRHNIVETKAVTRTHNIVDRINK